MSGETPGGGKGHDLRTVYVIIGVVLILLGIGLLGGIPFFGWSAPWGVLGNVTREIRRFGWPLAVIALGVLVIVYSRRPGARLPSKDARLMRSREKKVLAGVFGGLSDYFSVDVTILRVGYILLALIFDAWWPLIVAYIVAAIIVPEAPKQPEVPQVNQVAQVPEAAQGPEAPQVPQADREPEAPSEPDVPGRAGGAHEPEQPQSGSSAGP